MMFMMPMPPTNRVMETTAVTMRKEMLVNCLIILRASSTVKTRKSSCWSNLMPWARLRTPLTRSTVSSTRLESLAWMRMKTESPAADPYCWMAVVRGM